VGVIRPIALARPANPRASVLLATPPALTDGVLDLFASSCPSLAVEAVPTLASVASRLDGTEGGLVVAHLDTEPGGAALESLLDARPGGVRPRVIVLGSGAQTGKGLALLDRGAMDFLDWPREARRLTLLADLLTCRRDQTPAATPSGDDLVSTPGSEVEHLLKQVEKVAGVQTTVLLQGETGTGKTVLARHIHARSRRTGPLVEVNCAALPENLFESELFGHVKGAFTGAIRDRAGRLAAASSGTLFLDEVDALSPTSQAKLLRVLESGLYEPVGSDHTRPLHDVRFVGASNRQLDHEVTAGRFREDLLFRLKVVSFGVRPLREQGPALVTALARRFVDLYAARAGRVITGISDEAMSLLWRWQWPGNVRELRNVIERAVAFRTGGMLLAEDLPDEMQLPAVGAPPLRQPGGIADAKQSAERNLILTALQKTRNNRSRAAAELKISRNTLYTKLRQHGLLEVHV
jgi:DNA-binding NtrC family response regulator